MICHFEQQLHFSYGDLEKQLVSFSQQQQQQN
jgi:hypothetical protein